jgi:BMFP domain-containing protein YqiC
LLRVTSRDHNDALQKRINDLEKGNAKLKDTLSDLSWRLFPDRMGE